MANQDVKVQELLEWVEENKDEVTLEVLNDIKADYEEIKRVLRQFDTREYSTEIFKTALIKNFEAVSRITHVEDNEPTLTVETPRIGHIVEVYSDRKSVIDDDYFNIYVETEDDVLEFEDCEYNTVVAVIEKLTK